MTEAPAPTLEAPEATPAPAPAPEATPAPAPAPEATLDYSALKFDGLDVSDSVRSQFTELLGTHKVAPEAADAILSVAKEQATAQAEAFNQQVSEWATAAKSDPEFGGENFERNLGVAAQAMGKFATPELKTFLNETGLGNHPELVRLMYRVGKSISDDAFVSGQGSTAAPQGDTAKRLFPNMA